MIKKNSAAERMQKELFGSPGDPDELFNQFQKKEKQIQAEKRLDIYS
mgnify:FL=1